MKIKHYPKPVTATCPSCGSVFEMDKSDFKSHKLLYREGKLICTCPVCEKIFSPVDSQLKEMQGKVDYNFQEAAAAVNGLPKDERRKAVAQIFNKLYEDVMGVIYSYISEDKDEEDE